MSNCLILRRSSGNAKTPKIYAFPETNTLAQRTFDIKSVCPVYNKLTVNDFQFSYTSVSERNNYGPVGQHGDGVVSYNPSTGVLTKNEDYNIKYGDPTDLLTYNKYIVYFIWLE